VASGPINGTSDESSNSSGISIPTATAPNLQQESKRERDLAELDLAYMSDRDDLSGDSMGATERQRQR
jgi:hypothetical protein